MRAEGLGRGGIRRGRKGLYGERRRWWSCACRGRGSGLMMAVKLVGYIYTM